MYGFGNSPGEIATSIAGWTQLDVKLPAGLTTALKLFDAVRRVDTNHHPAFDISRVTPNNAEQLIGEHAAKLALTLAQPGSSSPLWRAKQEAESHAGRQVMAEAAEAVPDIISKLTPEFDRHAAAYVAAVVQLPEDLTADALVAAGPDAVIAFGVAQAEVAYLRKIAAWVASTGQLPDHRGDPDAELRGIVKPESHSQLAVLRNAAAGRESHELYAVDKVLFAAARNGVPFAILTLRETAQLREQLQGFVDA